MAKKGTVYLIGAGPGDTQLLTLRGADLLGRADVVVYDALVNPDLLRMAKPGAEIIFGGKRARDHSLPQSELNILLISKAREGKTVARLKGGDPYVFGRGAEEAEELADAGIPFEVVPGVSSFTAVPAYAGIPLTRRDMASRLTLITGHGEPGESSEKINWPQLASTPGTKVIMMGTERIGQIAETLVKHGMSDETPVAMVQWGTTGRQRSVAGTLATIASVAEKERIGPPTVAVIGEVVSLREKLNWFEGRALAGKRIVVTRAIEQSGALARRLADLGADVISVPTIRIEAPTNRQSLVDALLELNAYDWLVFTSPNGVNAFFGYFFKQFKDMRDLGGARIAAVGPATAEALQALHLQVDVTPKEALASSLAKALADFESVENLRICLLRAEVANPELPKALEEKGAIVDDIACYKTVPETEDPAGAASGLIEHGADWITFTSGSTATQFHQRFNLPEIVAKFPALRLASIGPETSKTLKSLGVTPAIEAKEHTIEGLVKALVAAAASHRGQS
jgi:uroporphyrinogen III methyltransferase/synthase